MREIFVIIGAAIFCVFIYLSFGMTGRYEYDLQGWFFAPARWLRQFFCWMIVGHQYENGRCVHCLKQKR